VYKRFGAITDLRNLCLFCRQLNDDGDEDVDQEDDDDDEDEGDEDADAADDD